MGMTNYALTTFVTIKDGVETEFVTRGMSLGIWLSERGYEILSVVVG